MLLALALLLGAQYDVVIAGGRVIDPESRLDAVRWVGIRGGKIAAISPTALRGTTVLDAGGHVVAPGFIDMHAHGQSDESYRLFAQNGVTTALELEAGTHDVPAWYSAREGKALINFGISSSHLQSRARVFNDPGQFLPTAEGANAVATPEQIAQITERVKAGLGAGGLGVGMGLQYTPGATKWEVLECQLTQLTIASRDREAQTCIVTPDP